MDFSIVIPTYKRPESLGKTLDSILAGTQLPNEVMVIDDDELSQDYIKRWRKECEERNIDFVYYKKNHNQERQGLSESKNIGMNQCSSEVLFYLDDDVIIDPHYCEHMMSAWDAHQDEEQLFAVGGKISNNRLRSVLEHWYSRLFGLTDKHTWDVNAVGFQCWDESVDETQKAHYIHGGVSSYRTDLLRTFGFAEFSGGRTGLEDVELGLRTKLADYYMYYAPSAQLAHYHEPSGREDRILSGVKESQNRKEIFRQHTAKNIKNQVHFVWANIGWVGKKILSGDLQYAWGMLRGLFRLR